MFHPDNIHQNQILVSVWLWNFFKVDDRGGLISENNGRFSNYPKNAIKDWRLKKLTTFAFGQFMTMTLTYFTKVWF